MRSRRRSAIWSAAASTPDGLLDELGTRWDITRNYFRLYACCNPIHPALDCLQEALAELRPRPDEIERIDIATYRFASVMRNPDPPNYFASKYSLPHAAAAMVVRGNAGYCRARRCGAAGSGDRGAAPARARDGRSGDDRGRAAAEAGARDGDADRRPHATHACESHRGDFQQPFAESEMREKFRELGGMRTDTGGGEAVEHAVDRCEEWDDVGVLTALCRRHGRRVSVRVQSAPQA